MNVKLTYREPHRTISTSAIGSGLLVLVVLVSFLVLGCATTRQTLVTEEIRETLNSFLYVETYDTFLGRLGQPVSVVQGDDLFVVTWKDEFSTPARVGSLFGRYTYVGGKTHTIQTIFSFDNTTRKLVAWNIKEY